MTNYKCPYCFQELDTEASKTLTHCPHCSKHLGQSEIAGDGEKKIGKYRIKERLGTGGMGDVYLAEQVDVGRLVAIKVLHPRLANDESYLQRFIREVQTLARIQHPNVVQAIEAGVDGDICYFVMMYIPGKDLMSRLGEIQRFSERDALKIARKIAGTLQYVWEKHKLIHRDIKPANIIVTPDGEIKLMDLGISKRVDKNDDQLTIPGMMVGSPHYISPEQARGRKDLDFRTDMYSLGATLYHLLTGKTPYQADEGMGVVACHITEPVPDPCDVVDSISVATGKLVSKMMAKESRDRFRNWGRAIARMDAILEKMGEKVTDPVIPGYPPKSFAELGKLIISLGVIGNSQVQRRARVYRLLFVLLVTLVAFSFMVQHSIKVNRERKIADMYMNAVEFNNLHAADISLAKEAIRRFERVKRTAHPLYASRAELEIGKILDKVVKYRKKRNQKIREDEWRSIEKKCYEYEKKYQFDKAISYLKKYRQQGSFRQQLEKRIREELRYLERQKEKMKNGLLND